MLHSSSNKLIIKKCLCIILGKPVILYLNPLAHLVGKHICSYVQRISRFLSKLAKKKKKNLLVQAAMEFITEKVEMPQQFGEVLHTGG